MATGLSISYSLILFSCLLLLLLQPSHSIYCDEEDCYDLLGVSQSANASEIKKAYYKLSLKYHPDKNPDPESRKVFVKVANAYEILKDEATREQYDYAIAHPEEVFYNAARYYHAYYGHKTDPRAVLFGLLVIVSAFQYLNQWTRYTQAINTVKKTPAFKNKLKALELERSGGMTNKRKGQKQINKKVEEDLSNELELQIQGAEKPSMWNLLAVQFLLLPYALGKILFWNLSWFWRYQIKKASYTWNDACYLTRSCLKVPLEAWQNIDEQIKNDLVLKRLWIKTDAYLQTLPKSGKSCLGEIIHRYITAEQFSPECLPDCLDLSSEHHTLEIANRIEAAIHVWRRRDRKRHPPHHKGMKSWTGKVKDLVGDTGKTHLLAEKAECLFQTLRLRYPCLPQTVLDMNKIQYNKDVGKSILESYSRVMESLAFNISARMDDLLYVDDSTKRSAAAELAPLFNRGFGGLPIQKRISPSPFSIHNTPCASPFATPSFCASTPVTASPGRSQHTLKKDSYHGKQNMNLVKHPPGDVERVRSYTGNLSAAKDACDATERD